MNGGILGSTYETYISLDSYNIEFVGEVYVSSFTGTKQGDVEIVSKIDDVYTVKLNGKRNGKYTFTLIDASEKEYSFEYHYDDELKTIVLNRT